MSQDLDPDLSPPPLKVLFVCSGNTCRSPMAEAIARSAVREMGWTDIEFRSAGTSTVPGLPASHGALRATERHGLSLAEHGSSVLSPDLIRWADLILTMATKHQARTVAQGGEGKTRLLGDYAGELAPGEDPSVQDPYGGDDELYETTFQTLDRYVRKALLRLERERRAP